MALGMSRDEYWNGDIFVPFDYIEADRYIQKRFNENAWLQGMYIYNGVTVALGNSFAKKGARTLEYPSRSYEIFPEEENKLSEESEALRARIYMEQLVNAYKK